MSENAASSRGSTTTTEPQPLSKPILRDLWTRMSAIYGHRWNSAYGDLSEDGTGKPTVAGDTWKRGLLGVTAQQVGTGLNACIASAEPWPPTLPEFRALCLGVPSLAAARTAMVEPEPTPFARQMWSYLDTHRMRLATSRDAERMVEGAYQQAREFVMRGGVLPGASEALPAPVPRKETVAECEARLRDLNGGHLPGEPAAVEVDA